MTPTNNEPIMILMHEAWLGVIFQDPLGFLSGQIRPWIAVFSWIRHHEKPAAGSSFFVWVGNPLPCIKTLPQLFSAKNGDFEKVRRSIAHINKSTWHLMSLYMKGLEIPAFIYFQTVLWFLPKQNQHSFRITTLTFYLPYPLRWGDFSHKKHAGW